MNNAAPCFDAAAVNYDKDETTEYQIRQFPTESPSFLPDWEDIFSPFRGSKPTVRRSRPNSDAPDLVWEIDPPHRLHGAYVAYKEFSYDDHGHVCELTPETGQEDGLQAGHLSDDASQYREIKEHIVSCPCVTVASSSY